jgi:hypothetical protein
MCNVAVNLFACGQKESGIRCVWENSDVASLPTEDKKGLKEYSGMLN